MACPVTSAISNMYNIAHMLLHYFTLVNDEMLYEIQGFLEVEGVLDFLAHLMNTICLSNHV